MVPFRVARYSPPGGPALNPAAAEAISVTALLGLLAWAVIRPGGWPELVAALPAALAVVVSGALSPGAARAEVRQLAPVIGFLAAVLVLAQLCDDEGVFRACGAWLARSCAGRPRRLLAGVFVVSSATTPPMLPAAAALAAHKKWPGNRPDSAPQVRVSC